MNDPAAASKDRYFEQLAKITNEMIEAHGRDFAIGALVLAARYIVENTPAAAAADAAARVEAPAASA